jgi:hypothetical protein
MCIATNSALMIHRRKRPSLDIAMAGADNFGALGLGYEIVDGAPTPERRYAQSEEERILTKAISSLQRTLRELVEVQQLLDPGNRKSDVHLSGRGKGTAVHAKVALRKSSTLKLMHRPRSGGEFRVLSAA